MPEKPRGSPVSPSSSFYHLYEAATTQPDDPALPPPGRLGSTVSTRHRQRQSQADHGSALSDSRLDLIGSLLSC